MNYKYSNVFTYWKLFWEVFFTVICFSFVFETVHGGGFYSSDTKTLDNLTNFLNEYDVIDKIYMEATDLRIKDDVHLNIEDLSEALPLELYPKVYMMHLRSEECLKKAHSLGLNVVKSDINCSISRIKDL